MRKPVSTCVFCAESVPHQFGRRDVGWMCARTGERVWPDGRSINCDMRRIEEPPHGWQPEIEVELL